MISVIIPTLLKVNRLYQTIQELSLSNEVGEIIIINNTQDEVDFNNPKIVQIFEGKNTYINPAWNKGAKLAKFDKLCIMNDDIWFDWKYLKYISQYITEDIGLIGMSNFNYQNPIYPFQINPIQPNLKTNRGHRPTGYACCFFIHKNNLVMKVIRWIMSFLVFNLLYALASWLSELYLGWVLSILPFTQTFFFLRTIKFCFYRF